MLEQGIHIWADAVDGLHRGLGPEELARAHPAWASDLERFSPWQEARADSRGRSRTFFSGAGGYEGPPVVVCGDCSSSLDAAWDMVDLLPVWGSVLAVSQWAGRGQLRRPWQSPPGNVHAALMWPETEPGHSPDLAPLLAGLVAAEAFAELGVDLRIKWPNDLLLNERKVGGILVEERAGRVMVGMGLNLAAGPPPQALRPEHACPAGVLTELAGQWGPLSLWAELAARARAWYAANVVGAEPKRLMGLVEKRLAWLGRLVAVHDSGFDKTGGQIVGISSSGALRLDQEGQEYLVATGSITPL